MGSETPFKTVSKHNAFANDFNSNFIKVLQNVSTFLESGFYVTHLDTITGLY